jgi:hypothetical protein
VDILTLPGVGTAGEVRRFDASLTTPLLDSFFAYSTFTGGAFVAGG